MTETVTGPVGVACLLEIDWPGEVPNQRSPTLYQVFLVSDGRIAHTQGHDDRDFALAAIQA